MLSLTVISANQGETYYTAENYYSPQENQQHSNWFGKGAHQLGLSGQIQGKAFKNLLQGYSPSRTKTLSGRKINPETRRAGLDLTFSAPKSISLAALVDGNEALEQAHRTAVNRTLAIIRRTLCPNPCSHLGRSKGDRHGQFSCCPVPPRHIP